MKKKSLILTDKEYEYKRQWEKEHKQVCACPSFYVHQSSISGIGRNTEIGCVTCGAEKDITDLSTW